MNPLSGNPNALVGGISGVAGGEIVVNIAKLFHQHISTGWGITIAAGVSYAVLFLGRNGLAGVWNLIMHGGKTSPPTVPPTVLQPPAPPPPG
jgi:hypothetical protein